MLKSYNYIGKHKLTIPNNFKWPREPNLFLDLSGSDIIIEKNTCISSGVNIFTHSHQFDNEEWRDLKILKFDNPTILKRNCFIGINSIILFTCKYIGISSVIGAGSVITKNIPDYEIWAGNPAIKIGNVNKK